NAFRSLLGIAGDVTAPTYAELYAKKSLPTTSSRSGS
ncbi:IS1595 family transposase, partial [Cupriavidus numazuensis]